MLDLVTAMQSEHVLGVLVHWEMRTTGAMLKPVDLAAAAEKHGVELDITPVSDEGVFAKILRNIRGIRSPLISKVVRESDGYILWAVVDTSLEGDEQVGEKVGKIVNRVGWAKVALAGQPRFVFEVEDEIAERVKDRYEYLTTYLDNDDLRRILSLLMRSWGAIRVFGRMQFLGRTRVETALALKAALAEVGTQCWLMPQLDIEDTHASIGHYSREQYEQDLRRYRQELERWTSGERAPRPTTLQQRLRDFDELGSEIRALASVVQVETGDVLDELAGLARAVKGLLDSLERGGAPEAPEVPPASETAPVATAPAPAPAAEGEQASSAPAPPARPIVPQDALESLSVAELRSRAKAAGVKPMPRARQRLIAALRRAEP